MNTLGFGIIGSGFMGRTYAECLARHCRSARLVAISGGRRAPELASAYQVDWIENVASVLTRRDVDAVIIATPQAVHSEQVLAAAHAGKHVLVEKPMAVTAAECDAMIRACRETGVALSVVQTWRFRGTVARAKRIVDEGRIGAVRMIELRTLFEWVPVIETNWLRDELNGGLLQDQGAHNFDFLRWFAGSEARCIFGRIIQSSHSGWPSPTAMAQVEFHNGVVAQTWLTFELPKPGISNSAFRALVVGETGMLDIDGFGKLQGALDGEAWTPIWEQPPIDYLNKPLDPVRLEAFFTQVQDFIDCIRESRAPLVAGEDGRAAIAMIDAVRRSSRTGHAIEL